MQLPIQTDNSTEMHPLEQAALHLTIKGDLETIRRLVATDFITFKEGTSLPSLCFVNAPDNQKNLLHYALIGRHQALASYYCANLPPRFLSAPIQFSTYSLHDAGTSPLHYAIEFGFDDVVKQLLNADVSLLHESRQSKETVLFLAVKMGNLPLVQVLVAKLLKDLKINDLRGYANHPSFYNSTGDTLLHVAADKGFFDIVQFLLATKIPVNDINLIGKTPLLVACAKGHTKIVECLLLNNANVNAVDHEGRSALSHAVAIDNVELVKLLLENGVTIKRKRMQPLAMAHPKIIALLFRYGAAIGENYPENVAQLAPIIEASNCLLLGTKINKMPVAEIRPAIFVGAIFDGQTIPDSSLGSATQEISILRCCKYALENTSLNPATHQTLAKLFSTRIKVAGLKQLLLHRLTDESFCQDVIAKSNIVVNIPLDLKEYMETFYSLLAKRNAIATIVEPISDTADSSREFLENLTTFESEILSLQEELRKTYAVRNKKGIAIITSTTVILCLIWLVALFLISRLNWDIPAKVASGVVITGAALILACVVLGCLYSYGRVVCLDSELPLTKLSQHHYDTIKILQQWMQHFQAPDYSRDDFVINHALSGWNYIKSGLEESIVNSHYSIGSYVAILDSMLHRFREDRPLIHLQFAKYSQFFKPYAKTPSLSSEAREQVFEFDIENNGLEL